VQFSIDIREAQDGWEVTVTDKRTGQPVLRPGTLEPLVRKLRSVGEEPNVFPQPPGEEADLIPDDADHAHRELCTTANAQLLRAAFRDIVARKPDGVTKFGGYLFATLLGEELWKLLLETARGKAGGGAPAEPVELALSWQRGDVYINRLPWEMMRASDRFLAQEPGIAITRRVASATQGVDQIDSPRVLFVVGSDLGTDEIRPGAEYLGLLRSLRNDHGLRLKTHILLRASRSRLKAAMSSFSPTVVHFICHGQANDSGEIFLKLMNNDGTGPDLIGADRLFDLLRPLPGAPLPQIVVLNACYTASEKPELFLKAGQVASPMAVRLVEGDEQGGVPIVVGMAGQVSDQACRLFTRCFYLSLLDGVDIPQATAAGRRLGIIDQGMTDPKGSVDWAMPTLFLADGVREPRLKVDPPPVGLNWHAVAAEFAPPDFPAFCDRLELFDLYDLLMSNYDALLEESQGMPARGAGEMKGIAVFVSKKEKVAEGQHGRTWLLHEFAAQAVLDGHVPVLVNNEWVRRGPDEYPKNFARLVEDVEGAISETAGRFKFDPPFSADCLHLLNDVMAGKEPDASKLPQDVQTVYRRVKNYDHPAVVSAAVRIDLLRLLHRARLQRPEKERARCKLFLLIDDVHQMDDAASDLLTHLLSVDGLRSSIGETPESPNALSDVRVVFTFDSTLGLGREEFIKNWIDRNKWVKPYGLHTFKKPLEERLAYQFFLSCWRDESRDPVPLTMVPNIDPQFGERFYENLSKEVQGVPSNIDSVKTAQFIRIYLDHPFPLLQRANDEDLLKLFEQRQGGL
jgi:CHAT domain